jgi:threonine synthase
LIKDEAQNPTGCAPIVRVFESKLDKAPVWENSEQTVAFGLRVPGALADFLILRALYASDGIAVAVSEAEVLRGTEEIATRLGVQTSPEGGACVAATRQLKASGWLNADDQVVTFNTGHGLRYAQGDGKDSPPFTRRVHSRKVLMGRLRVARSYRAT